MNKLKWKQYLNSIINTHDSEPLKYPSINGEATYCFKFKQTYYDELIICPSLGITNELFTHFFTEYRITALNVIFNGACCIGANETFNEDYAINGNIKLVYYPNKPKIEISTLQLDSVYWFIKAPVIDLCIHYEILPFHPTLMIPSYSNYTDINEFEEEYSILDKNVLESVQIENDITNDKLNEDMNITIFLANLL